METINVINFRRKNGFTLIEVLVSIVILSFVSIFFFSFMFQAYKNETKTMAKIKAIQLAYSCSEYLQSLKYGDISKNSCDFLKASDTFRNLNLTYKIEISQKEIIPNEIKLVDVIVKWNLYGNDNKYKLRILINKDV
ncbi:MAG TPA: prepilin-type N-terminal cleavage/methylation domain-containing protein [Hydrogenothermaceae bacterium]|nr:prepilin-type N-terminal cleavage/methylation domain-containing protein [Hydrogenothermaceae bacterium]